MAPSRVLRNGIILFGLWTFSRGGLTVPEAMGALALAEGAHLGVQILAYLRARRNLKETGGREGELLKRFLKFSFISQVHSAVGSFFSGSADILFLSASAGPVAVSFYSLAANVHNAAAKVFPVNLLREVVSPVLINTYVQRGNKEELVVGFNFFLKLFLLVEIPIVALFWALGGSVLPWAFGSDYSGAWLALAVFAAYQVSGSFIKLLNILATAVEKPQYLLAGRVFSVYNLLADLLFIPLWGLWGAFLATGSALWGLVFFLWFALRRDLPLRLHWLGLLVISLNSLAAGFVAWSLSWLAKGILGLLGVLIVFALVYCGLSRVLNPFTPPERRLFKELFGIKLF